MREDHRVDHHHGGEKSFWGRVVYGTI